MNVNDWTDGLKIQYRTQHYDLRDFEKERLEADLDALRNVIRDFPVSELHTEVIFHPRDATFHLKTSLRLPKRTIFTGERDQNLHPAHERCIRKLVSKVKAYKEKLEQKASQTRAARGIPEVIWPEREPDINRLEEAARDGDYAAFRTAMMVYDEPLQHRLGRWIQRYPAAEAMLGRQVLLSDFMEEVYAIAFEKFLTRPADRLGNWLERLMDPAIRSMASDQDEGKKQLGYLGELPRR